MRHLFAATFNRLVAMTLGLASAILYWPAIFGEFVWDDRMYLMDNDQIQLRSPLDFWAFFHHPTNNFLDFLPFRDWLISLQYQLFGFDPRGYHGVSLALYAVITMLVYRFSQFLYFRYAEVENRTLPKQHARIAAIISAGLFLAHPVHVEAVAWISGQKELLYVLFTLIALLSLNRYSENSGNARYHAAIFLFAYYLSFLCKLTAVGSLIFIPIYWWIALKAPQQKQLKYAVLWIVINIPVVLWIVYAHSGSDWDTFEAVIGAARNIGTRLQFVFKLAAVGGLFLIPIYWWKVLRSQRQRSNYSFFWVVVSILLVLWVIFASGFVSATSGFRGMDRDSFTQIIRATRILGAHAQLVLLPYPLNFGYPFDPSPLLDQYFLAGLSILLVAIVGVLLGPRSIMTLGFVLFLCYMLPALQLLAEVDNAIIFDRYLFFPLLGVSLIAGHASILLVDKWPVVRRATFATLTAGAIVLVFLTSQYIPKFSSDIASLEHAYSHFPGWDRAAFDYAYALLEAKELSRVAPVIEEEATFDYPIWVRNYFRGWLLLELGDVQHALPLLQQASRDAQGGGYYPFPQIHLARTYIALGNPILAKRILEYVIGQGNRQPLERIKALRLHRSL